MMKKIYDFACVWLALFSVGVCVGQNLDINEYKKGDNKIRTSGGLSANVVYNSVHSPSIPPISYFLSGNLTLSYKTFALPISVSYSNRKFTYSQPFSFNFATFRPTYKWISAEIGTCFTTFSPYSLNGHQYQGVGLTLSPRRWNVSMMYGRLLKASEGNPEANILPTYKRMGMGVKAAYKADHYTVGLTVFNAKDLPNSLASMLDSLRPNPRENLVIGLEFSTTLFKRLQLNGDYHSSTLNADQEQTSTETSGQKSLSGLFYRKGADVQSYNSYRLGLNYNLAATNSIIGIDYQRVDPDYVTLGGYYFVNDIENIALRYSQSLWKGKVNLSANAGLQWDDIARKKSSSQKRFVGMLSLNANPIDRLSVSVNFSNFTSYAYIRTAFDDIKRLNPFEQLDTLNYRQINQNVSTNMNYILASSETSVHGLNLDFAWMKSIGRQGDVVRLGQESGFINTNLLYSYAQPKKYQRFGVGLNASYNTIGTQQALSVGPLVNFQKGFLQNKLVTNASVAYILSTDNAPETSTNAFNLRGNLVYSWDKKNSLTSNIGLNQVSGGAFGSRTYVSVSVGYVNRF